jgi:adenylate kinase family enzyme
MDKGELVPDAVVIGMTDSKLDQNPAANGLSLMVFPLQHRLSLSMNCSEKNAHHGHAGP